jgi:Zn-dependent metalloprotease
VIRTSATLGALVSLALSVAPQPAPAGATDARAAGHATGPAARAASALARLTADAGGEVRVSRGVQGLARVVGVSDVHDPDVSPTMTPRAAALTHLQRYGALLGVADPVDDLVDGGVVRSVTGDDVVRFAQQRDGLPVIGGGVAVDLHPDRSLDGVTASVSVATVPDATYAAADARRVALAFATKSAEGRAGLVADLPRHMLYDPAVLGVAPTADPATQARGVWWVEVDGGPAYRRVLLVDDRSGSIVQSYDLVERVDRTVCDNDNDMTQTDIPCTTNAVRTEGAPPSRVPDVNHAYHLAGVVSGFYRQIGGFDLTRLIGYDDDGHRTLSSTVRYCDSFLPASQCPYANAFWNGQAMFYGDGYASADDVVGHEMTHGVIQHNSDLFYWGQSGAINESLADVMGEIIDHRHHVRGESRHNWAIGEDLPHGAVRSMRQPGRFGQPDSMTSRKYAPSKDFDNAGVHTNSGVGNRTWYLISQGGREGGVRVHGIDGPHLTRSATLYLDVIQRLVPGSDYADLAAVLQSSCHGLVEAHRLGMTRGDCHRVHEATLATRLRTSPPRAKQPADAPMSCPRGSGPVQVLFDSETGDPASKFDAGSTWLRAPSSAVYPPVAANATSGTGSWFSIEPDDTTVSSLTMHPVALPADQPSFLWFEQWRFLEAGTRFDGTPVNYDGGTVEVADRTLGQQPQPAEGLPWVNGPHDLLNGGFDNPSDGRVSFSRDSRGYVASRLDLRQYAGHSVSPQFTMNSDEVNPGQGWYLDDIRVYTCGSGPAPLTQRTPTSTVATGAVTP